MVILQQQRFAHIVPEPPGLMASRGIAQYVIIPARHGGSSLQPLRSTWRRLHLTPAFDRQPLGSLPMNSKPTSPQTRNVLLLRQLATIAGQVALLWFMSRAGHEVVALLHLPLPGNVAGMLLTFAALMSGVLPLRFVEQGAGLLVRNLPLFFVPLAVGFVTQGQLLAAHGFAIAATLIGSAAIGFAVTGRAAQLVTRLQVKSTVVVRSHHAETHLDRR